MSATATLDRVLYPSFDDNWDDELFRVRILRAMPPNARVLDLGAGSGILRQMNFRGIAAHICGIDPDSRVLSNPNLDHAHVCDGASIPYPASTFDLVFSDNVVEHLENPVAVFCEVARVLKPNGRFLIKTPNRRHYVPRIARWTPMLFHHAIARQRGRSSADTFRTLYRANTPGRLRALTNSAGFGAAEIDLIEGRPEYLRRWPALYLIGAAYERVVNAIAALAPWRVLMIAEFRKPHHARNDSEPVNSGAPVPLSYAQQDV